ncbi:UNVERIFIED_CONTAM: hypothetical protein PYX00_002010 [Menopon gallinae]|uniref:Uncharacterized protein n=1 Tax=Menopon gallinae TaxID=328185 RepID=A0AAW2IF94_9NEOP
MAILESCYCCTLAVSSAVLGVYLLVAYAIAFTIELWWILESPVPLPIPAYLLCLSFFILFIFSALLLHGLSVRRTTCLLVWMFMMGILLGPEAGLVLYMSIHYWRITSLYGLIEVTFWACRLLVNISGIICVQSLYSIWREEKSILMRLEALKMSPVPHVHQPRGRRLNVGYESHRNFGYVDTEGKAGLISEKTDLNSYPTIQYDEANEIYKQDEYDPRIFDPFYTSQSDGFSEFNATSFDASVVEARLRGMPYLTIRNKPKELERITEESEEDLIKHESIPKTRSLIDFTEIDYNNTESAKKNPGSKSISLNYINFIENKEKNAEKSDNSNWTGSLDRKIIKNKNLKILKKLSPFLSKKPIEEVNIYQINPPKEKKMSDPEMNFASLDSQLNKVYSNRGMYMFDEKTRKVIFYPPEFFNKSEMKKFYKRMDSYGSSQSRSSIDNDSEDLRHISDIAL